MRLPWTLGYVADGIGGSLVGDPGRLVADVVVDSRLVVGGSLFCALRGENVDGLQFADAALAGGASGVVVPGGFEGEPRIEVEDTSTALLDIAALRRAEIDVPVVAVTGSTGKTSTKDLLRSVLPNAAASPRSYNNEVGVPLTVLGAPSDADYLVVEVGSRGRGQIKWLMPAVRPDVAIITNLGLVHLESFGTVETLADAKWELVASLTESGTAVLPAGEPRLRRTHLGKTLTFGVEPSADIVVVDLTLDDWGRPTFDLLTANDRATVHLLLPGAPQALNAAATTAAGLALGLDLSTIVAGLESATGSAWRMEIHRGRFTVVNDAYNANPDSVLAALQTVAVLPGRHIAVLGKMAELGPVEVEEHRRMGSEAARLGYVAIVTVGDDPGIASGAGAIAHAADDAEAAMAMLDDLIEPGDVVLVKASRAVGLEGLAALLREEAGT